MIANLLFGLLSISLGFYLGLMRLEYDDALYSDLVKNITLFYSAFMVILPWFIGYYGPLWKKTWLWIFTFLMIAARIIYQYGPEIAPPAPWLYAGYPGFVGTFIYGIVSSRLLLKQKLIRKGVLFLIANCICLIFTSIFAIQEFSGYRLGIGYPQILFFIEGFMVVFVFIMAIQLSLDLSERNKLKYALAHQMERWHQTLDEVELVIVELDVAGVIKFVNPYFSKLTGFRSQDALAANWFEVFIPKKEQSNMLDVYKSILERDKSFYFQNPILTSSGDQKIIYWSNVVLKDEDGEIDGTLSIGVDVTRREKAFSEIEKLKVSLEKENIILKEEVLKDGNFERLKESDVIDQAIKKVQQVAKFQELDRLKSHFFANVSHEFRTPLTLILNPVRSLIAKNKDKKLHKELNLVERNASRLLEMVNQLLDLSKLEAGKMDASKKVGDLMKSIRYLSASFDSLASSKSITFKKLYSINKLVTEYNEDHLEKVLNNILSNAFKFTEENGKVTLILEVLDSSQQALSQESISIDSVKFAQIKVRDTGIGIEQSKLPHIFDRFYQAETSTTTKYEGTGIGLALVKDLVELHQGTIHVKSEPGWGTEVAIILPLNPVLEVKCGEDEVSSIQDENEIEPLALSAEQVRSKEPENLDSKFVVQIVEDNHDLRSHMKDMLKSHYQIIESINGAEGLESITEHVPDLVISDVMMPKMDGIEMTNKLKEDPRTSHIPVILLTAKTSKEDKLTGLKSGADEFLSKPFDEDELKVRIENLIQIRSKLQQQYAVSDFKIPKTKQDKEGQFLKKATEVVVDNIENDQFSVEDLSGELGMSRVQFHRKIKALTDQSTTTFIRNIRLERARQLLQQGDYNVTEVAYMVGFSSQSYFTKSFQKHFGKAPSAFQR